MRRQPDSRLGTLRRLQSAAGHLNAVIRMVECQAPCEEVLHQLCAVQAALRAVGCQIVEEQIQSHQEIIQYSQSPEDRSQAMEKMLVLFQMLTK